MTIRDLFSSFPYLYQRLPWHSRRQNRWNNNSKNDLPLLQKLWADQKTLEIEPSDSHFYDGLTKIKSIIKRNYRIRLVKKWVVIVFIAFLLGALCQLPKGREQTRYCLRFENSTLKQIADELEKTYNVNIEVRKNEIRNCKFTGTFYGFKTGEEVISKLAVVMNIKVIRQHGNKLRLEGIGCE